MTKTGPTPEQRVIAAITEHESTFIVPRHGEVHVETLWVVLDGVREKCALIWLPPDLGKSMYRDGILVPLETLPADKDALRVAMRGFGSFPQSQRAFLCRLSPKALRDAIL